MPRRSRCGSWSLIIAGAGSANNSARGWVHTLPGAGIVEPWIMRASHPSLQRRRPCRHPHCGEIPPYALPALRRRLWSSIGRKQCRGSWITLEPRTCDNRRPVVHTRWAMTVTSKTLFRYGTNLKLLVYTRTFEIVSRKLRPRMRAQHAQINFV